MLALLKIAPHQAALLDIFILKGAKLGKQTKQGGKVA